MKPKNQRLVLIASALVALVGSVLLAMIGLKDRAAYFLTPADIAAGKSAQGRAMRLGGMVETADNIDDVATGSYFVNVAAPQPLSAPARPASICC